jgi:flagellar hook-length control protein FliK
MRIPLPTPIDRSLLNVMGRPAESPRLPGRDVFGEHLAKVAAPERSRPTARGQAAPTPSARDERGSMSRTSSREEHDRMAARPAERDHDLNTDSDPSMSTADATSAEPPVTAVVEPNLDDAGGDTTATTEPGKSVEVHVEASASSAIHVTPPAVHALSEVSRTVVSTAATPVAAPVTTASLDAGSASGRPLPEQHWTAHPPRLGDQVTAGPVDGSDGKQSPTNGSPDQRLDASRAASEATRDPAMASHVETLNREASFKQPRTLDANAPPHAQPNRERNPHLIVQPSGAEPTLATPAGVRAADVDAAVRLANASAALAEAGPLVPGTAIANSIRLAGPSDVATVLTLGDSGVRSSGHQSDRAAISTLTGDTSAFAARLVRGMHAMIGHRGGVMTMRLDPPSLGELRIQVSIVDGAVSARFEAATEQAHALLKQNLGALRSALEGQGLSAERMVVHHAPNTDSSSQGRFADQQSDRDPRDTADGRSRGRQEQEHAPRDEQGRREQRPAFTLDAVNQSTEPRRQGAALQEAIR